MNKQFILTILLLGLTFFYQGQSVAVRQAANFIPQSDPIDAMVQDKITEFLSQYNEKLYFSKVTQCTKQTVAGKNYDLVLELSDSNNVPQFYNMKIYIKPWEKYVEVKSFEKLNQQQSEVGEVEQTQQKPKKFSQPKAFEDIMNSGSAQFIGKKVNETGKAQQIDFQTETDLVKTMIEKQIQNLLNTNTSIKITKALKQVVSGLKYYLEFTDGVQTYSAEFVIQLWNNTIKALNFKNISQEQQQQEKELKSEVEIQEEEQRQSDGANFQIDFQKEDENIKSMILRKIAENIKSKTVNLEEIIVTQASKQVVAGEIYKLHFAYKEIEYFAQLYVVPWENKIQLQKFTVQQEIEIQPLEKQEEPMDGGKFQIQFENEDENTKQELLRKISENLNISTVYLEKINVTQATKQVVAGNIYTLYFTYEQNDYFAKLYYVPWEKKVDLLKLTQFSKGCDYKSNHQQGGYTGDLTFFNMEQEPLEIQKLIKEKIVSLIDIDSEESIKFFKTKKQVNGDQYKLSFTDGTFFYKLILTLDQATQTAKLQRIFKFTQQQWEQFKQMRQNWGQQGGHHQQWNQTPNSDNLQQQQWQGFRGGKQFQNKKMDGFAEIVGELQEIDFSKVDSGIRDMLLQAIGNQLNVSESDIQVLKAKYQVVNGLKYELTFQIGDSVNYVEAFIQPIKKIVKLNNLKQNI